MDNIDYINDYSSLEHLRRQGINGDATARKNALQQAANQFEAFFTQMWLKVQRESTKELNRDNPLSSSTSELYQSMLDEQMSAQLASCGISMQSGGLSSLIVKQLDRGESSKSTGELHMPNETRSFVLKQDPKAFSLEGARRETAAARIPMKSEYFGKEYAPESSGVSGKADLLEDIKLQKKFEIKGRDGKSGELQQAFVDKLMPIAKKVAAKFGLDPLVMVAQAALETGWGKHLMKKGAEVANNFYGIKAGGRKGGSTTRANSYEYINGRKVMVNSSFRAYSSIESSMEDYARLITENKRYSKVKDAESADNYFEELQKAGYATDPKYAAKLKSIIRNPAFKEYWS